MSDLTVAERIAAGAAWLDEHYSGWWLVIDLDALCMDDCKDCVLGQLYEDFNRAPLTIDETLALGFTLDEVGTGAWLALTYMWRDLTAARRSSVSTVAGVS